MKFNNFEGLAELLTVLKKEKAQQSISPMPVVEDSIDKSSKDSKVSHKEILRRAKATYKKSCLISEKTQDGYTLDKTNQDKECNCPQSNVPQSTAPKQSGKRRKAISREEIDSELENLVKTAESVYQFNTICRKFRETLEDSEIVSYYDIASKKALDDFIASLSSKPEHKTHKRNKKKTVAILCSMTNKERHKLNGDKSKKSGYSSTGVKLPTRRELDQYHEKRMEERERHDQFIRENPDRKRHGKMIIYIASGGQNKKH